MSNVLDANGSALVSRLYTTFCAAKFEPLVNDTSIASARYRYQLEYRDILYHFVALTAGSFTFVPGHNSHELAGT